MNAMQQLTFLVLCRAEPRLSALEAGLRAVAASLKERRSSCADEVWRGRFSSGQPGVKARLSELIGVDRKHTHPDNEVDTMLQSCQAYEVAVAYLTRLLPDCRGCACGGDSG